MLPESQLISTEESSCHRSPSSRWTSGILRLMGTETEGNDGRWDTFTQWLLLENAMSNQAGKGVLPWWPTRKGFAGEGTFFRLQVHERVGISLVQVYKRLLGYHNGKKMNMLAKLKGLTYAFYGRGKVEKTFWFCDLFIFYRQCTPAVKRNAKF